MNREGQDPEAPDSSLVLVARFTGHGLTIAASTALFLLAGWWVDGRLGTTPLLTIVGALVGAGAGFYSMLQHLLLRPRAEEQEKAERRMPEAGPEDDPGRRQP